MKPTKTIHYETPPNCPPQRSQTHARNSQSVTHAPGTDNAPNAAKMALLGDIITPSQRAILEYIGLPAVLDWLVAGDLLQPIAERLGVGVTALTVWLNSAENVERYREARRLSAHVMQDEGLSIVDKESTNAALSSASVALAKIRFDARARLAGLRDRTQSERYTPPEEVQPRGVVMSSFVFVVSGANNPPQTTHAEPITINQTPSNGADGGSGHDDQ